MSVNIFFIQKKIVEKIKYLLYNINSYILSH